MDIFERIANHPGILGKYQEQAHGYYMFPKLEGEMGPRMKFMGKERLIWSLNNYLGLGNHPDVRRVDAEAAAEWGMAYPMGARMMSGQTKYHEQLESELADFVGKEDAYLLNYGYQGMFSIIDALVDRKDVIVYDSEAHACIIDGMRMHFGKRFVYPHNNMENLRKELERATKITNQTGGGILVISEGVYGMTGDLAKLDQMVALKKEFNFRLMVDDAHGLGTMGKTGAGTAEHYGVEDQVDLIFGTFAKAMAGIGGFIAGDKTIIRHLMYNARSQVYAKSLPMPMVIGALKRLEMIRTQPEHKENLWKVVNTLQDGLRANGLNLGKSESPVTPVVLPGSVGEATQITHSLREEYNIFCSLIIYPVVPKGTILLRLIPTAVHSLEDVEYTVDKFATIKKNLDAGKFSSDIAEMVVD